MLSIAAVAGSSLYTVSLFCGIILIINCRGFFFYVYWQINKRVSQDLISQCIIPKM